MSVATRTTSKLRKRRPELFAERGNMFDRSIQNADKYQDRYASSFTGMGDTNNMFSGLANDINQERGKAYTDTTEGRSFLGTMRDQREQGANQINNAASLMNLSPEAYLSMMDSQNRSQSASMRDMFAGSDQRRSNLTSQYSGALAQLFGGQQGLFGAKYGIDQDIMGAKFGIESQRYAADQQRRAANAGAIGSGIGGLLNGVSSFIPTK
jgi:hypothetical protein